LELSCIRQLIDEDICPHSLKKKSQRCGATLSLVKDQFGGTIGRKKKESVNGLASGQPSFPPKICI
jgi:hypothetical protein